MSPTRSLALQGAFNVRDMGGFSAADGRRVKRGLVFRADGLSDLADADVDILAGLGLKTVVDFRTREETVFAPDRLPETVQRVATVSIDAGRLVGNFYGGEMNRKKSFGVMVSVYRQLAGDFTGQYREFFSLLSDAGNLPLLFHCTAGKDRTGFAAALFLLALGVSREDAIQDYLLSADYLRKKYVPGRDYDEVMEPLYTVYQEYIDAALEVAASRSGGIDGYLRDDLRVDPDALRNEFTE